MKMGIHRAPYRCDYFMSENLIFTFVCGFTVIWWCLISLIATEILHYPLMPVTICAVYDHIPNPPPTHTHTKGYLKSLFLSCYMPQFHSKFQCTTIQMLCILMQLMSLTIVEQQDSLCNRDKRNLEMAIYITLKQQNTLFENGNTLTSQSTPVNALQCVLGNQGDMASSNFCLEIQS